MYKRSILFVLLVLLICLIEQEVKIKIVQNDINNRFIFKFYYINSYLLTKANPRPKLTKILPIVFPIYLDIFALLKNILTLEAENE